MLGKDRNALNEMRQKSGQMAVPVIDIEGKIIVEFNRKLSGHISWEEII